MNESQVKGAFHSSKLTGADPSPRNKNFTFNQNYPATSVKSWLICKKKDGFLAKTLGKTRFQFQTDWSDRPVLTNGKRFKIVSELSETG